MTLTQLTRAPLAAGLVVSVSPDVMGTVVTLSGEADLFTLPLVVDGLARAIADHDGSIIVDLADTDFIDTGNARALVRASQFLDDHGRTLTLRSPSRAAARLLDLLGFSSLIEPSGATP